MSTSAIAQEVQNLRASLPVLLTVAEAAELSRSSTSSIRRRIDNGKLPFNQRDGGAIFVPRDAVLDWAFKLEIKTTPPSPPRPPRVRRQEEPASTVAGGKSSGRRKPLRLPMGGNAAVERLTPEAMREFAAAYAS
jgi:excisionase family DNA binding protein